MESGIPDKADTSFYTTRRIGTHVETLVQVPSTPWEGVHHPDGSDAVGMILYTFGQMSSF